MTTLPSPPDPLLDDRRIALSTAAALTPSPTAGDGRPGAAGVLTDATAIYGWLTGPTGFVITVSPAVPQGTPLTAPKGLPVQLTDTQQVDLTVQATDSKGSPVAEGGAKLTWSIDNSSVATLNVGTDTLSCTVVAGTVGSGVITVSSGSLAATIAVDVVAGSAAKFAVSEGTPTEQPSIPAAS